MFEDCIIPNVDDDSVEYIVSVDNRNVGVKELKDLETYLKTEFCLNNYDFKVTYFDSSTNYGIQLADLIVNTFYNFYKNKTIVENVVSVLKDEKYKISVFPKKGIRQKKNSII